MRNKGMIGTILATILVITLAVILAVSYFLLKNYVILGGQLFPKNQETLDLRNQAITAAEYETLGWKIPRTNIIWSVPMAGNYFDSSSTEITVTRFSDGDVGCLRYFPNLKTVDAGSCTDYAALKKAYLEYPNITFRYQIPVAGTLYDPDTTTVTVSSLSQADVSNLENMPCLTEVDGRSCKEFTLMQQLEQSHPQWRVEYLQAIGGTPFSADDVELEVTGAAYAELNVGLAAMPKLQTLTIHDPDATGAELQQLRAEYPSVSIHWDVSFFGKTFRDDAAEVDISNAPISGIDQAKEIADRFPQLQKLIVDSGSIDNEEMAAYREEVRSQYKVVWTVVFTSNCKSRTDETKFMPIDQGEYYFKEEHVAPLRYCEDMVCIDLGHSTIKTIDFVSYMPHLKYLILAWTQVQHIDPIENCKELIYLEIDHCIIRDYTPLLGCTALQDINISDAQADASIEPIKQMTWLKNLWVGERSAYDQYALIDALPDTNVVISNPSTASGHGWRNLPNYYAMRDYLGREYMQ